MRDRYSGRTELLERAGKLREVFMAMREQMHALAELNREAERQWGEQSDGIEEARQKISRAHFEVWKQMRDAVFEDWLNVTETPDVFRLYPPKDMPKPKGGRFGA